MGIFSTTDIYNTVVKEKINIVVWKIEHQNHEVFISRFPVADIVHTLDAVSMRIPHGVYTTFRTFERVKALRLDHHLSRLDQSAELAGQPVLIDFDQIKGALRSAVHEFNAPGDVRIRVSVDLEQNPGQIYIIVEDLVVPMPEAYQNGVKLVTCDLIRVNPKAKLTNFIPRADTIRSELESDVHEALMVGEDGRIREGLSSNFFAVKHGHIWTDDVGVLAGVTRGLVIEAAVEIGVGVNYPGIRLSDVPELEEAFISSSSRAVLPVSQIDSHLMGIEMPGPVTRNLMETYDSCLQTKIENI